MFHDSTSDCSMLYNIYGIECQGVIDTQVTHRMIYEAMYGSSMDTKHSAISLDYMIREYLGVNNHIKNEIKTLMMQDNYFWRKVNNNLMFLF